MHVAITARPAGTPSPVPDGDPRTSGVLDALAHSFLQPEKAPGILTNHRLLRVLVIVLGLASITRLLVVAIDVHRMAILDMAWALLLPPLARGGILHSLVIASCAAAIPPTGSALTARWIASRSGQSWKALAPALLVASLVRFPVLAGPSIIFMQLSGALFIFNNVGMTVAWGIGLALVIFEVLRVAGKVASNAGCMAVKAVFVAAGSWIISIGMAGIIVASIGGFG